MRRRQLLFLAIGVVACLVVIGLVFGCHHREKPASIQAGLAQGVDTVPMLIMQVQQCSKLYTAEYRVHKIITHDDALRFKGQLLSKSFDVKVPLADRKIAIPMDAKIKAYIDFSEFSEKNIERSGDRITIVLPDPQVVMTSSKIDQRHVKQYVGLTRAHFSDEELAGYQQQGRGLAISSRVGRLSCRASPVWGLRRRPGPMPPRCWYPCSPNWVMRSRTSPLLSARIWISDTDFAD